MKHKPGDGSRRRTLAYRKGRCDLAAEILDLLHEGKLDTAQERLKAEAKVERRLE